MSIVRGNTKIVHKKKLADSSASRAARQKILAHTECRSSMLSRRPCTQYAADS